jgi:hypothetical protein
MEGLNPGRPYGAKTLGALYLYINELYAEKIGKEQAGRVRCDEGLAVRGRRRGRRGGELPTQCLELVATADKRRFASLSLIWNRLIVNR